MVSSAELSDAFSRGAVAVSLFCLFANPRQDLTVFGRFALDLTFAFAVLTAPTSESEPQLPGADRHLHALFLDRIARLSPFDPRTNGSAQAV